MLDAIQRVIDCALARNIPCMIAVGTIASVVLVSPLTKYVLSVWSTRKQSAMHSRS